MLASDWLLAAGMLRPNQVSFGAMKTGMFASKIMQLFQRLWWLHIRHFTRGLVALP